jgi:4-oxalocrotonate tautomerase
MPMIHVEMYEGRTNEQKAELAKAITKAVVDIAKTTPESTHIIFTDVPKANMAHGGILASES